jgi:hypothetical protein
MPANISVLSYDGGLHGPGYDALAHLIAYVADHRVGLPTAGLTIGKNSSVITVEHIPDGLPRHQLKSVLLAEHRRQHPIQRVHRVVLQHGCRLGKEAHALTAKPVAR